MLDLLAGKATVDQVAFRYGVRPETVEGWRQDAVGAVAEAMRQGNQKGAREAALEKKLQVLERAFTDLAIRNEIAERALRDRPTRPVR